MGTCWVVTSTPEVGKLVELARSLGDTVAAVTVGVRALGGVDSGVCLPLPDGLPVEAIAPAVASAIPAYPGDIILVPDLPAERSLAGAIAARFGAPVLTGLIGYTDGVFEVARFNGLTREFVRTEGIAVVLADAGGACPGATTALANGVEGASYRAVVSAESSCLGDVVDLAAATRIVAVGRGIGGDIDPAKALAEALHAELACSRPVAEAGQLSHDRAVGASGRRVAPKLYVAAGISGQLQHMTGCSGADTIVAINNDAHAPVFALCDHGIVGDVSDVLPALTKALHE